MVTNQGADLLSLSQDSRILLVFLRHFGCVFCKEALEDIRNIESELRDQGVQVVFVHMGEEAEADLFFEKYKLAHMPRIASPDQAYYKQFQLGRGRASQLASFRVFLRGFEAASKGHLPGAVLGDGFQMPGVFLVSKGRVVFEYRHSTAADRPDYLQIAADHAGHS